MMFCVRRMVVVPVLLTALCLPAFAATPDAGRYDHLKRFGKVLDLIRTSYVREANPEELITSAIKGMLQGLDPHSTFLDKEEFKEMQETTTGKFYGVGIEISTENNQIIVVSPIEDTPAYKAGVKAGDAILAVDSQPTQDMSMQEVVSKIRGPKGSEVELLLLHKADKTPVAVKIIRDAIPLISVKARFIDEDGILWVRLTRFSERTTEELRDAIEAMKKKAPIKGVVLDLRNNPGGLLDQSVEVADVFLRRGVIVSMRGRGDEVLKSFDAKADSSDVNVPMVVLVNSGSASASEIVAGALQDHNRAVLVGERTFGKGSVQNIIPLEDGTAVKLTIALYYTPSGRSIQAEGIVPDIVIPFEAPREEEGSPRFNIPREKDLSRHLEVKRDGAKDDGSKDGAKVDGAKDKPKLVEDDTAKILSQDNQLRMGLQLVRGLPKISEIHAR